MQRLSAFVVSLVLLGVPACSHPHRPAAQSAHLAPAPLPLAAAPPSSPPILMQSWSAAGPVASLADAEAASAFPLLVPSDIPSAYQLISMMSCCGPGADKSISLTYQSPDGRDALGDTPNFRFVQGDTLLEHPPPLSGDPRFACMEGTATVQGQSAIWWKEQIDFNAPQDACRPENASRKAVLELEWPVKGAASGARYQLSSTALNLDQLLAIADSAQPYHGP